MKEIVGKIENYDVIYLPEKDLVFCKNTTMPYLVMRKALIIDKIDRQELKEGLIMSINKEIVRLACLTTTLENIQQINTNIQKIKKNGKRTN